MNASPVRPKITISVGAVIAVLGTVIFIAEDNVSLTSFDEMMRGCVFGTAMMLGGLNIVAVGLLAWCRREGE
jgi:hypothetical protein